MAWTFLLEICDAGCLKNCLLKSPLQEHGCLSPTCVNSREGPLASLGVDKLGDLLLALSTVGDSLLLCIHGEEGESSCADCSSETVPSLAFTLGFTSTSFSFVDPERAF